MIFKKKGEFKKAIDNYEYSIEENEYYPYSYLNLAVIYKEFKEYQKALNVITEGIEKNKNISILYYNRAIFLTYLGKFNEAIEDLKKSTKLSPSLIKYMLEDEELIPLHEIPEFYNIKKTN